MKLTIPTMSGLITRRLLINYRVAPQVAARLLPAPFRPKLIQGQALAGICLIRLEQLHPKAFPVRVGFSSENVAHRIAVEWDDHDVHREGVFIPRRDSDSRLNAIAGGRLFPGIHHHARFWTAQGDRRFKVEMRSNDRMHFVRVAARVAETWPADSVFATATEASSFFRHGARGWSPCACGCDLEGMELHTSDWRVEPLVVERVESSWFEDAHRFPEGSFAFDNALLMRNIHHEWHALGLFSEQPKANHNRHGTTAFFQLP